MGWRRGKPRKLPDPRKSKFAELVGAGVPRVKAALESGVAPELETMGAVRQSIHTNLLLRDPQVVETLINRLQAYAAGWEKIEVLSRGILTRQMLGIDASGQIVDTTPAELENLQQRAALGALAILSRHAPEALAERAKAEDKAAESFEDMARRIVGQLPEHTEAQSQEPPTMAPSPSDGDEDVH